MRRLHGTDVESIPPGFHQEDVIVANFLDNLAGPTARTKKSAETHFPMSSPGLACVVQRARFNPVSVLKTGAFSVRIRTNSSAHAQHERGMNHARRSEQGARIRLTQYQ